MKNKKIIDLEYAASSFLQFRSLFDLFQFHEDIEVREFESYEPRKSVESSKEVDEFIQAYVDENVDDKTALMLSGGIDSAILASYLPKGSLTITFDTGNELSKQEIRNAKLFADYYELKHEVLPITWDDYLELTEDLMRQKGAPIHSIEVQIAKAALFSKKIGYNKLLFGEAADVVFGGFDGLLSKDWTYEEFMHRYSYLDPREILKNGFFIDDVFRKYKKGRFIDVHGFLSNEFYKETLGSYQNACDFGGVKFLTPYPHMRLEKLDYERVRSGDSKYILRELYSSKYPDLFVPEKVPMPRAMGEWLLEWEGPQHSMFNNSFDFDSLKPDQKWIIYILDLFLRGL